MQWMKERRSNRHAEMTARCSGEPTSGSPSAQDKMQDQRDHRKYKQQVDQSSRHVEHREATNPRY